MTDFRKYDWKQEKKTIISILEDTINLLKDISHSFKNDYPRSRISRFRYLCYGYILISNTNIKSSLLLVQNNMMYQIHYISRNMFEMVVNLYYINDCESKREERIKRFFDYNIVQRYKILDTFEQIPEIIQDFRIEKYDDLIQNEYNKYKSQYKITQKIVTDWSGLSLYKMIEELSDDRKRNDLLRGFYLLTKTNNQYIHPSIEYIKTIIKEEYGEGVKHRNKDPMEVSLLGSIYVSISKIIEVYLEHFQKKRQTFQNKLDELETRYRNIPSEKNI